MHSFYSHSDSHRQKIQANSSSSSACDIHDVYPPLKDTAMNTVVSPTTYLLLAVLQLLQYCCSANAGTIHIAPMTQHANISDSVTFYCRATGINTKWSISKYSEPAVTFNARNHTEGDYTFSQIVSHGNTNVENTHDMYLWIPATPETNGTVVLCIVWADTVTTSDAAEIIVQGGPSAPVPVLNMISPTKIVLEWDPPFTWPYTMISHYKISVNTSLENWNRTAYTETSLVITSHRDLYECRKYTFSVLANNGLSDGQWGHTTGGFPIVPRPYTDPIDVSVTFKPDYSPIIHLTIKLPVVCSYQQIEYLVILKEPTPSSGSSEDSSSADSGVVFTSGPTSIFYGDMPVIQLTIDDKQLKGKDSLLVNVTFTEESNVVPIFQEKRINMSLGLSAGSQTTLVTEQVVLIGAVCGTLILILTVFIIVFGFVCVYRKRKRGVYRSGSPSPKRSPMVVNPIYEGQPVYETIDPRLQSISISPTNKCPPVMMESPYNLSNIDPNYAYLQTRTHSFPPPQVDEQYTIMTSVGALGKREYSSGESNLDRDVAEVDRYVPQPSTLISEC